MEKNKAHQTSQGFNRIRTRILALTLSILTLFTAIPTTAYAEDSVGGNISGGGQGGMGASSDYKAWSSDDQGYRFYLVDGNFNRVTDVYDYIYSMPDNIGDEYYTTRFDTASSPQGHIVMDISRLAELTNQPVSSIPKPVQHNKGQGKEFKAWFLKNLKTTGGSGGLHAGSSGYHKGSGSSSGSSSSSSSGSSSSSSSSSKSDTVPDSIKKVYNGALRSTLGNGAELSELSDEDKKVVAKEKKKALQMGQLTYDGVSSYIGNGMSINDARAYAALTVRSMYRDSYGMKVASYLADYIYNGIQTLRKTPTGNLLTDTIPLATSDTPYEDTSTTNCPAITFLTDTKAIQVPGYSSAMEALVKGGYNIVYEPITWLYVNEGGVGYETRKTYGTYENILRKWVTHSGKPSKSFYHSYMGSLGNNCLVLSQDYISEDSTRTLKGITSEDSRLTTESLNLIDSGYGLSMHMLCSTDMGYASGTHTYDPLLGTTPGPAPDPSDLPQDSPDKGGNTITIIKNYVTETNGTEQTDGNYIRKQNPHTIEIEDEPNYTVVDWNTSTADAPSISNGSKNPWNEVIKTSTKTQIGNSSTAVELSNKEKVMYIKLKKADGISENPEVSGDWVINESELTTSVSSKQATIFLHKIWV